MMELEQTFREYVSAVNDSKGDFSRVSNLFDLIYHDNFNIEIGGKLVNKGQMCNVHSNYLAMGTEMKLLHFGAACSGGVTFKLLMKNDKIEVVIHNFVLVKDGKFWKAGAADGHISFLEDVKRTSDFYSLEKKANDYFNVFDGKIKSFEEISGPYDELYHEEFVHVTDGSPFNKSQMRFAIEKLLCFGGRVTLLKFGNLESDHVEVKLRIECGGKDSIVCNRGTIKDGKLVKLEPFEENKRVYAELKEVVGTKGVDAEAKAVGCGGTNVSHVISQ